MPLASPQLVDTVPEVVGFRPTEGMTLLRETLDAHDTLRVPSPIPLAQFPKPVENRYCLAFSVVADIRARHLTLPL